MEKAFLDANRSFEVAKENDLESLYSSCFFRIGEIFMLKKDFKKAASFYENAVSSFSGYEAEKGDFIYHWGEAVWKTGDKFIPFGMHGSKNVSDILNELKLPLHKKEVAPIVVSKNEIVWIPGYRIADKFKVTPKTSTVLRLIFNLEKNGK